MCAAGEIVRGTVRGMDRHPGARGLTVSLEHDARRLKDRRPVESRFELGGRAAADLRFELAVPGDALPTFEGRHYASAWRVEARLDLPGAPDVGVSAPLVVTPEVRAAPAAGRPVSGEATGIARFRLFAGIFLIADLAALAGIYAAFGSVPAPIAMAFVAPGLVTLAALVWLGLRPGPVERLVISAPREAWRFGEEVVVRVSVRSDPDHAGEVVVVLKGEEVWVVSTGKSSHEVRHAFHQDERRIAGRGRREEEIRFPLPEAGAPSHGRAIQWSVEARVPVPGRPDPRARLSLEIGGRIPDATP